LSPTNAEITEKIRITTNHNLDTVLVQNVVLKFSTGHVTNTVKTQRNALKSSGS